MPDKEKKLTIIPVTVPAHELGTNREMIKYIGNDDPTTRRMLEEILVVEEEHAAE